MTAAGEAERPSTHPLRAHPLGVVSVVMLVAFAYTVLLGGTGRAELDGWLRLLNVVIAGFFIVLYFLRAPAQADRVDRGILLGLLLFAAAAVLSQFPRQAFDAVLGAVTVTAFLFVARGELANPEVRTAFVRVMRGLCIVMTLLTATWWLPGVLEWWSLNDWTVIPPLDLNLSAAPWGHRHDLALLAVLLYPSLWIGHLSAVRRVLAVVLGVLVVLIVIVDGSRNLWLAILGSSVLLAVLPAYRRLRGSRRALWGTLIAFTAVAAILFVSGLASALVDRLGSLQSLDWRAAMWAALIQAWGERPLAGYGPGSFPWVLQLTDYFQTSSWAPRHPDSAFFQLLAEGGILGLAAAGTVLATLAGSVVRAHSTAARWALLTFVLACIGANPTDFAFLVAVAAAWTAYAVPRLPENLPEQGQSTPWLRPVLAGGLVVVGLAYAAATGAGIFYDQARRAVADGNLPEASGNLDLAVAMDPGMALYPRQRGALAYVTGHHPDAIHDLALATRLNPSDDQAWRVLALAYSASGNQTAAEAALAKALDTQRADPANLLLSARWNADEGRNAESLETLAEIVQAWPATVGADHWKDVLPDSVTTSDVVDEAILRWREDLPAPEPFGGQGLWLAVLGARSDLVPHAVDASGVSDALARAAVAVLNCDPESARYIDQLDGADRRVQLYWHLRIRESALRGTIDGDALTALGIMRGAGIVPDAATVSLNPLEETGVSTDIWGYRRRPIAWPEQADRLPSFEAAELRWLLDPTGSVRAANLEKRLPACT